MENTTQLVSFGNYLLKTYGVKIFVTATGELPNEIQREVTDADLANWREEQKKTDEPIG